MSGPIKLVGKVAAERIMGFGPGRLRAAAAATVAGAAGAVVTYRLLRSHTD